jgi:hypothetical protein
MCAEHPNRSIEHSEIRPVVVVHYLCVFVLCTGRFFWTSEIFPYCRSFPSDPPPHTHSTRAQPRHKLPHHAIINPLPIGRRARKTRCNHAPCPCLIHVPFILGASMQLCPAAASAHAARHSVRQLRSDGELGLPLLMRVVTLARADFCALSECFRGRDYVLAVVEDGGG